MPRSEKQKLKILYVADYLRRKTDENHPVYVKDLVDYLADKGIEAESHSISRDIALLRDEFGMKVSGGKGRPYFYISDVSEEEVFAIAASVASAKFLSESRSKQLVRIACELGNDYTIEKIKGTAFTLERYRTETNTLKNVTLLREAIQKKRKIVFKQVDHIIGKNGKVITKTSDYIRVVDPIDLVADEGFYYLVSSHIYNKDYYPMDKYFSPNAPIRRVFTLIRVDLMREIFILNQPAEGLNEYVEDGYRVEKLVNDLEVVRDRKLEYIKIRFPKFLLPSFYPRFGNKANYKVVSHPSGMTYCELTANVDMFRFLPWIIQNGDWVEVVEPPEAVEEYRSMLHRLFWKQFHTVLEEHKR